MKALLIVTLTLLTTACTSLNISNTDEIGYINLKTEGEYVAKPLSGHPHYTEPESFPIYKVDMSKAKLLKDISFINAAVVCAFIKEGDIINLYSGGGYVAAGYAMMNCIKDKNVTMVISRAMSMATSVLLSAKYVCFKRGAELGYHQPYINTNHGSEALAEEKLLAMEVEEKNQLRDFGYSEAKLEYLKMFARLSYETDRLALMPLGTMAGILGDRFVGYCEDKS